MKHWEHNCVTSWDAVKQLENDGWELVAVTETFSQWENSRKRHMESSTDTTYYLKREVATGQPEEIPAREGK